MVWAVGRGLLDQPGEEEAVNRWLDAILSKKREKISLYRVDPEDGGSHRDECGEMLPEVVVLTEEQMTRGDLFGPAILQGRVFHAVVHDGQLRVLEMDGDRLVLAEMEELGGEMVEVPDEEGEEKEVEEA